MADAPTMPIPGMLLSRLLASFERCSIMIRLSSDHRLYRMKPRRQYDEAGVSIDRQARVPFARNDLQQLLEPRVPLCSHNAELSQMRPQGIDQLGPLPHQKIARPMQHQTALLLH